MTVYRSFIAFIAALATLPAAAKVSTLALTITGPGLEIPLQTDDEEAIRANVWAGNFARWDKRVETPASELPSYHVYFWVQIEEVADVAYQLRFVLDAERALVCLPAGRDSRWYRTNAASILREGQDGFCFESDPAWGAALRRVIEEATAVAAD